jgi:hypothetical protein
MFDSNDDNDKGSLDKGKGKATDQNPDSDNDSNSSDSPKADTRVLANGMSLMVVIFELTGLNLYN